MQQHKRDLVRVFQESFVIGPLPKRIPNRGQQFYERGCYTRVIIKTPPSYWKLRKATHSQPFVADVRIAKRIMLLAAAAASFLPGSSPRSHLSPPLRPAVRMVEEDVKDYVRVWGSPEVRAVSSTAPNFTKPVLLYLPGIELSGYTIHRQVAELSHDYDVHYLTVPQQDRTPFNGLVDIVSDAIAPDKPTTGGAPPPSTTIAKGRSTRRNSENSLRTNSQLERPHSPPPPAAPAQPSP